MIYEDSDKFMNTLLDGTSWSIIAHANIIPKYFPVKGSPGSILEYFLFVFGISDKVYY